MSSNSPVVVNGLYNGDPNLSGTLDLGGYSVTPKGLTVDGGIITDGTMTVNSPSAITSNGGTISANLSGTAGLTMSGSATLYLSGNDSGLSGNIAVNSGVLKMGSATALGTG